MRLREDSFLTGFPPGWRFMNIWETATRQDAELLVHAFRAICREYLPGGSTGVCELVSLPLPTIVRVMELIISKAAASKRILLAHVKPREISPKAAPPIGVAALLPRGRASDSDARPLRPHLHYDDYGGSRCCIQCLCSWCYFARFVHYLRSVQFSPLEHMHPSCVIVSNCVRF
jgi:hypothetical protein